MTDGKWTEMDVPNQAGRTVVITGGNTGIGFEAARALAAHDASVVLAVRNLDKGKDAANRIYAAFPGADVTVQQLDLSSLISVSVAAQELLAKHHKIDLLINNAGVMLTPKELTSDGFELQFATNHLGHFALTGLLLDRLLLAAGSRVVTISSMAHRQLSPRIHFDDLQWEHRYSRFGAYSQSKLANLMFTYELQRRLAGKATIAVAAHPGGSNTELPRNFPAPLRAITSLTGRLLFQSAAMGALPTLRAATDPNVLGGQYYGPDGFQEGRGYPKLVRSSTQSHDAEQQRRLWAISEELTGVTFPI
jgi:NAD(P)-dependent dehydrogenase (short-subunit alcohol dehydrogenase family)